MAQPISDHFNIQFTTNVELLLQQEQPYLAGTVMEGGYTGEKAQVVNQFGEVEFEDHPQANWKAATTFSDIDHQQRWVYPTDKKLALPVAKEEEIRMIVNPKNPYTQAMRAAYARLYDTTIIDAALGDNIVGKYSSPTTVPLPAEQKIADGGEGLTLDKLLEAKELLDKAENSKTDQRFIIVSARQITNLLKVTEVKSSDYNTVKALVAGELDTYVGFKFIRSELLPLDTAIRSCVAYVKSGLHFGKWNALETHIDIRPDLNYIWQIYMKCTVGATRTQEKKVIQIDCSEA